MPLASNDSAKHEFFLAKSGRSVANPSPPLRSRVPEKDHF
jgi:hypothetical protein